MGIAERVQQRNVSCVYLVSIVVGGGPGRTA